MCSKYSSSVHAAEVYVFPLTIPRALWNINWYDGSLVFHHTSSCLIKMQGEHVDSTKNKIREHYQPTISQSHQHQEYVTGLRMTGVLALHVACLLAFIVSFPLSNAFPYHEKNYLFLAKQFHRRTSITSCPYYKPYHEKQIFFFSYFSKALSNIVSRPSIICKP